MLTIYLKTTWRILWRHKAFSLINILGLALGITAFVLILEYVSFERSFNRFHQNLATLYQVQTQTPEGEVWVDMAPAVAPLLKQQFPEVQAYCRLAEGFGSGVVSTALGKTNQGPQLFRETKLAYADASFFKLFTFPVMQGQATTALQAPNTVALSQTQAQKYFGNQPALGQVIALNNQFGKTLYKVTAVYADMPLNSDLRFDAIFSLITLANPANLNGNGWARLDGFDGSFLTTFLQLSPGADHRALAAKIDALARQRDPQDQNHFLVQPAGNLHLAASLSAPGRANGSLGFVYLLEGIAGLILVIAWFNYVNLSTAGALKRAKEVGIRKVIGARTGQLIGQFLSESLFLNLAGFVLALGLVTLLQSTFNELVKKELNLDVLQTENFWLLGLGLLLTGALGSGLYVAFTLVTFQPVQTLKGTPRTGRGFWLRKTLVVGQFSASVLLIIATLVLNKQLQYMQGQDLGFKMDQRIVTQGPQVGDDAAVASGSALLKQQLSQLPYVKNFSQSSMVPGGFYSFTATGIAKPGAPALDSKKNYKMGIIDDQYLKTYSIAVAAGRNFTHQEATLAWEKSAKVMLNETAARELGFASAAAAVGKTISWGQLYQVVGVVRNYHHQGLKQAIDPIIFLPSLYKGPITVQLSPDRMTRKIAELEQLYLASYPGNPFEYYFLNDRYNEQYQQEQQYSKVFTVASALAIFIACLGLFGLVAFTTEQRTKEIGIRKVLGASVANILGLISRDFLKLVVLANLLAWPVAWWGMHRWLQDFEYRITLTWPIFAAAALLAILIALLTISVQAIKASLANPVHSLRNE
ncbi:ABC transporter permease [Adhaeribacter radiodurans]|uniref:ABC transporter permease n=1 Tax=Adhaeribacter radiodurans TaxID=2745197 RepID=A0A7L7LFD0_9BACT|nr:ABC transporter permease [Adhaeribacter radiodurans]QMU31215.1 ABC transporter permease [Adhaeribacter radiodurans]